MLKDVQQLASQTLNLSMMPLEQWAKWTDDSQRQLKALIDQSKATQDEMFAKAVAEVKAMEVQTSSTLGQLKSAFGAANNTGSLLARGAGSQAMADSTDDAAPQSASGSEAKVVSEVADNATAAAPVETVESVEAVEQARQLIADSVTQAPETGVSDDLTRISGVGPALAKKLNAAGYSTFAQIAALSDDDIAELESTVIRFSGRILRDDWKGQASRFIETA